MAKKTKYISARNFSLNEWLELVFSEKKDITFPNNCFPNDPARDEYLNNVKKLSEAEVKNLLRILLPRTARIGADQTALSFVMQTNPEKIIDLINNNEYWRRNFSGKLDVWEGLTWILDLLPYHPKEAINVLDSYFIAHCQQMTDQQLLGNSDCTDIIRARYYNFEHPREILLDIEPIEFEWLIEKLYSNLGYETKLTKIRSDEGIDIVAVKNKIGKKELALIQCKRYKDNIGSAFVRDLNGIVASKKATKGVLVATSEFTKEANNFADENPSIELIGYKKLTKLLNIHLGTNWPRQLDSILRNKKLNQKKGST